MSGCFPARHNIAKDVYEKKDLKAQRPETVKQLLKKLDAWQKTLPKKSGSHLFSNERIKQTQ